MRSVKTTGRGMTETQRLVWLLSMPMCSSMTESMQSLTGVSYETSEHHKEISNTRQERDSKDTIDIMHYLHEHDPFNDTNCTLCDS